jgi:hypothetical protein
MYSSAMKGSMPPPIVPPCLSLVDSSSSTPPLTGSLDRSLLEEVYEDEGAVCVWRVVGRVASVVLQ